MTGRASPRRRQATTTMEAKAAPTNRLVDAEMESEIRGLRREGKSVREIAWILGVSGSTVGRYVNEPLLADQTDQPRRGEDPTKALDLSQHSNGAPRVLRRPAHRYRVTARHGDEWLPAVLVEAGDEGEAIGKVRKLHKDFLNEAARARKKHFWKWFVYRMA